MPILRSWSIVPLVLAVSAIGLYTGCRPSSDAYTSPEAPLFSTLTARETGIDFINEVTDGEGYNVLSYRNFYNGAGVAIADLNGDGMNDLYFTANQGPNRLYLNRGDWKFEEVEGGAAGAMSWSTGVSAVDVNADGRIDLYVCNSGDPAGQHRSNELFINQGNDDRGIPIFREAAVEYGLDDQGFSTHAAWFDYDKDGDLDVYLLNNSYLNPQVIDPSGDNRSRRDPEGGDKLFRNDSAPGGQPHFTDVSEEAGIYGSRIGFGLGSGLGDFNGDNWTDLYISNDFWERDYLYINQRDGTFREELIDRIDHVSISSMGSDVGDLDNDGDMDIFSTDMLAADNQRLKASTVFDTYTSAGIRYEANYHHQILQNCLQVNDGTANFSEVAHFAGVSATDWSWGALIFDMDLDGRKDIFVANGIYRDIMDLDFSDFIDDKDRVKQMVIDKGRYDWRDFVNLMPHNDQPNYAFLNRGDLRFENRSYELGLGEPSFSNGAAYGDLDGDGDLDLIVNNLNQPPLVYRNGAREAGQHSLVVRLQGPSTNPLGIGATARLITANQTQVLEQYPTRGFLSTVGPELIFGVGADENPTQLEVRWPDGRVSRVDHPTVDGVTVVDHAGSIDAEIVPPAVEDQTLFVAADAFDVPPTHEEPFFNDFDHERLLLRKLSDPGPKIVKGDVNGDGREDFLLLGSANDPDKLYFQEADGSFRRVANASLEQSAPFESSCGAFFDADGDGDVDLLVGNGGNELARGFDAYVVRYYENLDGTLVYNPVMAPQAGGEISCIVPEDIDLDGDIDLFIGGRAVPGNYGLVPQSFLFIREGSQWVNSTPRDIATAGMVTDAVWSDLNSDGRPDLIMVGDWMPVTVAFMLNDAKISSIFEVPNSSGWYNAIAAADLDGDGLEDLVVGNWGLNSKFRASAERPLRLLTKDFDQNDKSEFIIEWYPPADARRYPFAQKKQLHEQLPGLRKKTLKYEDYARATYETLFTEEERQGVIERGAQQLQSCVIWNKGEGKVITEPLPWQAQLNPQFTIAIGDVNGDDRPDLWLGGNIYGLSPQVGRADAGRGTLLLNAGDRQWEYVEPTRAGINLQGQVRDAQWLDLANGGQTLLIARNDAELKAFRINKQTSR
ncbi:hypothetical protein GGR28_001312 [Lewinella aquimaris]|uniref:ASPIC/UnbV domain-containing protein n=1 Tax=Neolewinella aquimaris TaxID=1835722 RepID=A0A840EA61_9BACT|nr:VCBS repeat-containing protein [Neolewinella aquimaris]MBB4078699.1 hypothetical protein [Neolewinella aquimaris]